MKQILKQVVKKSVALIQVALMNAPEKLKPGERIVELKPIKETASDFDELEKRIKELFKREIYFPLLAELQEPKDLIENSSDVLVKAIRSGRLTFSRGEFFGRSNAATSKELRSLGAVWDRKHSTWRILLSSLPPEVADAIRASESVFQTKLGRIDAKLAKILPEEISGKLKASDLFDRALWRTEKAFEASVKGIALAPEISRGQRKRIADEWQKNMQLWIQDFTKTEILELRSNIKKATFKGVRYGAAIRAIQDSYGVSSSKAKFLARQETSLLMAKYKQTRYKDAGVTAYIWGCVSGSKLHPVRPAHKKLEGKRFSWDTPPITSEPGQAVRRNNPGQDYNCRCFARPIVRFRT